MSREIAIKSATAFANKIFDLTLDIIEKEADPLGIVSLKVVPLIARICQLTNKEQSEVYAHIRLVISSHPEYEIRQGRHGGIYKIIK